MPNDPWRLCCGRCGSRSLRPRVDKRGHWCLACRHTVAAWDLKQGRWAGGRV